MVENLKQLAKAGDDPKKRRKLVRKKAPEGMVVVERGDLRAAGRGRARAADQQHAGVDAMLLNVIDRPGDPFAAMRRLLTDNHEPRKRQLRHIREAVGIARSLLQAGVVERLDEPDDRRPALPADRRPAARLRPQPAAVARSRSPRSTCSTRRRRPTRWTSSRSSRRRSRTRARSWRRSRTRPGARPWPQMKAEGIEYDERMELLDEVTYPKPLDELLEARLRGVPAEQPVGRRRRSCRRSPSCATCASGR